jgi:mono/diheme cytochrome c family protein
MPKWLLPAFVVVFTLSLIPFALIARARAMRQSTPRINIIPDLDIQNRYEAQSENRLFADGRAMRPPVDGTVARGELRADTRFYAGKDGETWVTSIPVPVTEALLARGRERFGIYCAPCHGLGGFGDGLVAQRADALAQGTWTPPSSFHTDLVRGRTDGELFNTISHGIRNMPPYGSQVTPADRWAIVAYVRALQRSQNARLADVPEDQRAALR